MEKLYIKRLQHTIALTLSLAGSLYHMAWAEPAATALPTGEEKLSHATVTRDETKPVMTINQDKGQSRAFISWDTFNIGKNATVNIKQYSGADLLINAVRGNSMSEIAGKLNATGNVALINPNGVIFMNGAQINVGGLGVYATGYDAKNGIVNSGKEGNIEIQSGATINVGVSAVLANLKALSIDPKDYAIAIDSTGEDGYTNRIHLVAEGNVDIQGGTTAAPTKITAKDYTYVGSNASVGEEGFNVGVGASGMGGKIYIRSDRDADDYGQVIITHGDDGSKPVMQSVNGVSIYTNAEQVDGDNDTTNGINAAVSRVESGDGATTTYYTKHDYKKIPTFDIDGSAYTDATSVSVDGPGTTADKLSNDTSDTNKNKISTSYAGNGATTVTTSLLVNNIDQLQDIEDENTGNLDGRYVLGRAIDAKNDAHAYIDDGVLYTKNSDGNVKKWSTADSVEITGTKSGGDLSKTVNGTTIGYSSTGNKATTKLTDGTTLSNSNGTVGAENTQWSTTKGGTTKGVSTVTDKTANSEYTIQSDNSVVNNGLTSNTTAKTITDGSSYTADISNNTITHTSDNSVTNTKSDTVTKPAGTSDAGYTATITDGTDTTAGTSGTIAIKGITYQVTNGSVGDTVTYQDSSVTTSTNTVKTGSVTTTVAKNSTAADAVKEGTIAGNTVTVDGTTTKVTDGTTSYQITSGTNVVTYTKGKTTASISGKKVTTGEVSADTNANTVTQGATTASITSSTAGTVRYDSKNYTVANGTVSLADGTTGETVPDDVKTAVLDFFNRANESLTAAKGIYSDYTNATKLASALSSAIKTLSDVEANSTNSSKVQSTFSAAAKQLQSDTNLFNTASTALTNATTALNQYNALQKAITDNTNLETSLKQAYDEFQSTHLNETTINNIHSDKWDGGKGFNPIGDSDKPFTGTIDGFSGERVFGISNLTINRPEEDNVGLVAVAGTSGNAAGFGNVHLYDTAITGKNNVGTIAGTLQSGSTISWSEVSGKVTGSGENIGGFAGLASGNSISYSSNYAAVDSKGTDGIETGTHVGGIAGMLNTNSTLKDVHNFGDISGAEDVGGLAGYVENSTIVGSTNAVNKFYNTYNNGTVKGTTNTGGIVGHAKGIYMYGVFNTNEDAPLSKKSQLIIGDDNKVIQRGDDKKDGKGNLISDAAGKTITDTDLQSNYGRVKGEGTNTGGLVGYLEDAPGFSKTVTNINVSSKTTENKDGTTTKEVIKDASITNNVIDTSYNAGNIEGKDSTGGLVGKMTGGTLSNVYNADNNTVLRELGTIPDAVKNAKIEDTSDHSKTYAYSKTKVSEPNNKDTTNNQDLTQYYSFFAVGSDGTRTYYYFLPVSTTSGTTQKGAGGVYVDKDGNAVASLPSTKERYYFNRTFNKDANVTGTGKNTGGLVGSMTTTAGTTAAKYSAGSVIDSAYNAGTITGSDTATTGALVGSKDAASLINDSFYVTGKDVTNGKVYSNVNHAVGTSSTDTSKITNTAALDAVESKKKYYVSDDSKRANFPGVQQKSYSDKDSSGNITVTYYEYTSGTNGSFYTDGTGSMDSISHIYPITTTGTTDSSTGKTTYTSTRSTKASYTRQDDGTFKDTSGNKDTDGTIYTATYDTATRQIVLTPMSGSSSNTVVLNAVLAARTANETWTIYEDQTRPLLTAFLNKASLSRTFNYDGTTHNLKTDDVANLYGRADFDGSAGKDVQLSNYQLSSNGVSSEYTYDNTSIWSPQHGYYMDPESTLVINPVNMSANLYGTRVYGDIFNTRGYYVCVPYTVTTEDGKSTTTKYSFYKPAEDGSENYTHLSDTDVINFLGKKNATEADLLAKAEDNGFYVLELNGFINGEGVDNLGKLITGLVTTLSKSDSTSGATSDTTRGKDLQHLFSNVTADTYLDAGIYNVTNAQITGLTATNQNYTINYGGQLTVKQAELYYTYDGSREYGLQNTDKSATHTYTLVGVDSDAADSNGRKTSTHGFLKSWDITGKTITIKDKDGNTTATIENPYKDFFTATTVDGKTTYAINQKYIGVEGYTAEKTTTTTDVTTGKSTTTTDKDETKSVTLDDLYEHMKGTVNTDSINKPSADSTTTPKTIGSYGTGAVDTDMYTHVLVDKDGNPIGYKVTSFASTNASADTNSTIQLYFKTDVKDSQVKEDAVKRFNQNYKLVWKEGRTYDKKYTIGKPETVTTAEDTGDAGIKTETGGLKVNDSTFTILPKTATVTITGNRQYGDTMGTSSFSTTTRKISKDGSDGELTTAAGLDTTAGTYNINIDGLTNGDDEDVLDSKKTKDLLLKIDNKDGTAADAKDGKEINPYTNVVRDTTTKEANYQNINGFEKSKISVVNDVVTDGKATNQMKVKSTATGEPDSILTSNNYDYILQDGTHQLKIMPVDIHVKVSGGKTYGDFTSQAATDYTVSVSGGKTYDGKQTGQVQLKNNEVADIVIANNLNEQSDAGTYTYDSSDPKDVDKSLTISLKDDTANTDANDYNADNYNISFDTTYTINQAELWYTYEGSRDYGADNTTTKSTFKLVGIDGADSNERVRGFLKSWDVDTYKVDTANGNTIALTLGGADAATLYAMSGMADDAANKKDTTIRSITGGNSADAYSHVIVDSTGKVIGYNLSLLGLSSDANLSLTDTAKNTAFKTNYKLVWKPQVQAGTDGKGTILSPQTTTASVKDTAGTVSTNTAKTVNVGASTLTINPVALTVEVTGKREYGHTMGTDYAVSKDADRTTITADGKGTVKASGLKNETYNINLDGLKNGDGESVLDDTAVKNLLGGIDAGDSTAADKISRYTSVKQSGSLATDIDYQEKKVYTPMT
jgi:filamentous hemagglutinin family protein